MSSCIMNSGYNERQKSNLTIIFSALLIPLRAANPMWLDGVSTMSDGLS
jgi:hypothetical protein